MGARAVTQTALDLDNLILRLRVGTPGDPGSDARGAWLRQLPVRYLVRSTLSEHLSRSALVSEMRFHEWCQETGYSYESLPDDC